MFRLALAGIVLIGLTAVARPTPARAAATASGEAAAPKHGVQHVIAPAKPQPAKPRPFRSPVAYAPLVRPQRSDPGQCRLTCDRSLYFCEATDDLDRCGGTWTQCRAACSRPAPSDR